jgi:hypothetical protein
MQTKSAHVGEITLPLGCANVHYEEPVSQLELQPSQVLAASKPNQSTAHHGRILHCAMSEHGHVPASFSRVVATADSPAATCVCDKIKCQIQIFRTDNTHQLLLRKPFLHPVILHVLDTSVHLARCSLCYHNRALRYCVCISPLLYFLFQLASLRSSKY